MKSIYERISGGAGRTTRRSRRYLLPEIEGRELLLPLETVEYVGREARLSPRAEAKRTLDSDALALALAAFR